MKELYLTHINEAMNALISANNMPGLKGNSNSVYIVNYMQNNAFAQGLTTDYKMRHMITRDPDDSKLKMKSVDNQDEYGFDNTTDIKGVYRVLDKAGLSEALEKIESNLDNEVSEGFIYECILGDKMYTWDQIEFNDKVEKIVPYDELIKGMNESIRNYTLYGKEKAELISEIKYGNKDMSTLLQEYNNILDKYKFINIFDNSIYNYKSKVFIDNERHRCIINNEQLEYFIDNSKNNIIGCISIIFRNYVIFIENFTIFEDYRGKELSKIFLNNIIKKYNINILAVYKDNNIAINLYKKFNFKPLCTINDSDYIKFRDSKLDLNDTILKYSNKDGNMIIMSNSKNLKNIYENTLLNESEDKSKNTYKLSTKYKRPYTYEEIVKYYGQKVADKLKKDPVHRWRMDTGIELIHKEPTLDELNRIWNNWKYMTDDMKRESDKKSKELFNMDNITHYKELIKTYYLDEIKYGNKDLLLNESEDKSKLTKDYKKNSVPYRVIDIHNDECYKYFDKEEIDWYRNADRQGEILVETRCHSAIGYIYTRKLKNGDVVPGPFKVFDYYKGMGFGEILLKDVINKFGVNTLNVFIDNKVAIALYKKVGFRILETRVDKNNEKYYIMKL